MKKHGKNYRKVAEKITKDKIYNLSEACKLALETSPVKFDATIEIHINTGTRPKYADQIIRNSIVLPHGTGKTKKIAVFCNENKEDEAKKAGADYVGKDELIANVLKGKIEFEIAVAEPSCMRDLAKIAKILGPKGLMPSPKSGTVTPNITEAITEIKKGKIEFKNDKEGIVHTVLGKISFGEQKILENTKSFLRALLDVKPATVKGSYIQKMTITTAMGPAIIVNIQEAISNV